MTKAKAKTVPDLLKEALALCDDEAKPDGDCESVASLVAGLKEKKEQLATIRDDLRDKVGELEELEESCGNAVDYLESAIDTLSEYV